MRDKNYVLDSFAMLCLLEDQAGAERVGELIADPTVAKYMSVVNFGEVLYIIERRREHDSAHLIQAVTEGKEIMLVDVDLEQTVRAARLKAIGGLSYANCFAVSLAKGLGAVIVTGDPEFSAVEGDVPVEWLG
jgi:PIN domain nuclease of toxin-antitoxin system